MRVEVAAEHIAKGICGSRTKCPIALAVRDHIGHVGLVESLCIEADYIGYVTDDGVKNIIEWYDETGEMTPFVLELQECKARVAE